MVDPDWNVNLIGTVDPDGTTDPDCNVDPGGTNNDLDPVPDGTFDPRRDSRLKVFVIDCRRSVFKNLTFDIFSWSTANGFTISIISLFEFFSKKMLQM